MLLNIMTKVTFFSHMMSVGNEVNLNDIMKE